MRWQRQNYGKWDRYFAWHPIEVDQEWIWLEWVERKYEWPYTFALYRLPKEALNDGKETK